MARASTDGLGVAARAAPCPPPARSLDSQRRDCVGLQRRDCVYGPLVNRWSWRCRAGRPLPPPPLRARHFLALQLRSITDVAEEKWQRLHRWPGAGGPSPPLRACRFSGTATALGCNAEAVSMAPSPTDGLGIAERADPCPPPLCARSSPGAAIVFGCGCC